MKSLIVLFGIALTIGCSGNPGVPAHEAVVVAPKENKVDVAFGNDTKQPLKNVAPADSRFSSGWESLHVGELATAFQKTLSARGINAASFTYTVLSRDVAKSTIKTGQWYSDDLTETQFSVLADDAFFILATAENCGDMMLLVPSTRMYDAGSTSGFFDRNHTTNACVEGVAPSVTKTKTKLLEVRAGQQLQLF